VAVELARDSLKEGFMSERNYTAIIQREDKIYVAECPEVGAISQGYSIEEAVENLKEATELYLEDFSIPDTGKAIMTTFEAHIDA
jgi:predicted RNase H-like HicB family nuclease